MERKIGEIFEYNGEWYQCIVGNGCENCAFNERKCYTFTDNNDPIGDCCAERRKDNKDVIFKKLEKVGEPYMLEDKKFQKYRVFKTPYIYNKIDYSWQSFADPYYISLEIKQNKEDMEEKNNNHYDGRMDEECIPLCDALNSLPGVETTSSCCGHCKNYFMIFFNCNSSYSLSVIARAFNRRYSGTFLEWKIEVETNDNGRYDYFMHSVKPYPNESEMKTDVGQLIENLETWKAEEYKEYFNYEGQENEQKPNIKPFDIQKAREGKLVCTRDGRKARIVCFDRIDDRPILALVPSTDGKGEDVFDYFVSGKRIGNSLESDLDLVMLPEKKEGWVNVYKSQIYNTSESAEECRKRTTDYIKTIRVEWEE